MSNASIEQLQEQLNSLKNIPVPGVKPPTMGLSIEDIRQTVKDVLAAELALLKAPKPLTLLEAIGLALTQEEQVWLSDPARLQGVEMHLPLFFQTQEGQASVRAFVKYYKEAHGQST